MSTPHHRGLSCTWTCMETRSRCCCRYLPTWPPSRSFPAQPSSRSCRPLTDGLRGGKKGSEKMEWLADKDAAFAGAKQALLSATHLAHPTVVAELSVVVDASAKHVRCAHSSSCLARRTGSPWVSSQISWRQPSRNSLLLTGSCLPATPVSVISGTC
jgi:hypothetical protein